MTASGGRPLTPARLARLMDIPFSAQQLDAITAPLEPAVVVAGAGSGKTTVMAARVVWLVATGAVSAEQVLGLTFTNKAAAEFNARVRAALVTAGVVPGLQPAVGDEAVGAGEPTVLTYHAYAGQLLHEHGLRIGYEPDVALLTDAVRFQLAERAVRRHRSPIEHLTTSLPHVVRYVLALDAQLCEHLVTPDDVRRWQREERPRWAAAKPTAAVVDVLAKFAAREELLLLVEDYRSVKAERGVMDFSDQIERSARLAEHSPEVGAQERARYPVVLLDEYQDTSVAQARLMRSLFSGPSGDLGRGHPVTAVGDPCQAIYGWRGASASNLDAFARDFPPTATPSTAATRSDTANPSLPAARSVAATHLAGAEPVTTTAPAANSFPLNVNRRSQTAILDVANALAQPLYALHVGASPLGAPPETGEGSVRAAVLETFDDELQFLATEVPRAFARMADPTWSQIAVLVRDNLASAAVHDVLVAAGVPVEVVGLSGLLTMPEIIDVVATLEVLHDVTANAALLQLLTSPRWSIGHRDLALLGRRARELAAIPDSDPRSLAGALESAVAGTDPAEAVCLLEALLDPGRRHFSAAARQRFELLASELRHLQRHVGEPLLDLVRRVVDTLGVDVELAASNSRLADSRRDNLATFLDAVATFAGTGSEASLPGLLAYLRAEEEYASGLPLAVPSQNNSVKLLTVHKAKGLEWEVAFVPGLTRDVFPTRQTRPRWTTALQEMPWALRGDADDLPQPADPSRRGLADFAAACREHELFEERRLGYVAFTRARSALVASGHWWGPEQVRLRGPSEFLDVVLDFLRARGTEPEVNVPRPADGAENPSNRKQRRYAWPVESAGVELQVRRAAADLVERSRLAGWQTAAATAAGRLSSEERADVAMWDVEIARLIEEAETGTAREVVVALPRSLSATTALRLQSDPAGLARELARPMPRKPSSAARFGTRFHAWVEARFGQQQLLAFDDIPGRADDGSSSDAELEALTSAFSAGPFGNLSPCQVEAPFALVLGGHVVRGRIDAVYETDVGYRIVDWKTNAEHTADPLQLAIYRVAWAELKGVDVESVQAVFYYVRSGEVVQPDDLPGRDQLEQLLIAG